MVSPNMNLISGTHHSCERRKYAFMVLREYTIISRNSYRVTPFLSCKFLKDRMVKNKKLLSIIISLNIYQINSIRIISLLIKCFLCLFFSLLIKFFSFYCNSFFYAIPSTFPPSPSFYTFLILVSFFLP